MGFCARTSSRSEKEPLGKIPSFAKVNDPPVQSLSREKESAWACGKGIQKFLKNQTIHLQVVENYDPSVLAVVN
jgi:hypothetical protein